ncbi:hypothetical protein K488DRAFT_44633 [Vararia minispora EC-137]|uniref:Uncharacterized protein n=1 Tax=Vararia minispora EC-137 TaxID=1314806 RepID=A0ACB8QTR5_9AGAM|nr:hypothetical protein K488DRAFT_44633 [Vararia minispora EC-137]
MLALFLLASYLLLSPEPWPVSLHIAKRPPDFKAWHDAELALPQNNASLPPPQGRQGRYVRFSNHYTHEGWGNVMQELLMNAHLAYVANATFVMYNYTWDPYARGDASLFLFTKVVPARTPMSALVAGPVAGGSYPEEAWRPPAVTPEFFEKICPEPTLFDVSRLKNESEIHPWTSASDIMDVFSAHIQTSRDNCMEFKADTGRIFDWDLFANVERMRSLWPTFKHSPILTEWAWSPLVSSILRDNYARIHPLAGDAESNSILPGLLAMHIRRGDFVRHCTRLADRNQTYQAFNAFEGMLDQFVPPRGWGGERNQAYYDAYRERCYPEQEAIVAKVSQVRMEALEQGRPLNRIYVLTNGDAAWTKDLERELRGEGEWESVTSSRDLEVDWEQHFVAQAADMVIAARAEIFIGNAWSSLTSNVNMLRVVRGVPIETSRFW